MGCCALLRKRYKKGFPGSIFNFKVANPAPSCPRDPEIPTHRLGRWQSRREPGDGAAAGQPPAPTGSGRARWMGAHGRRHGQCREEVEQRALRSHSGRGARAHLGALYRAALPQLEELEVCGAPKRLPSSQQGMLTNMGLGRWRAFQCWMGATWQERLVDASFHTVYCH